MPEKISILKESGETLSSNVVSVFQVPDTEKKYIITTENAVDPHGLTVLHVSEIVDGSLRKVATDEEWSSIKTIMRAIISGNVGSYSYLPKIENATASGQYSRDISVSSSASKQMVDNYNAAVTAIAGQGGSSTIFPTEENKTNEEEELMPGISEVGAEPNPEAVLSTGSALENQPPEVNLQNTGPIEPIQDIQAQNVATPVTPVQPVQSVQPVQEVAPAPEAMPPVQEVQPVAPVNPAVPPLVENSTIAPQTPVDMSGLANESLSITGPIPTVPTEPLLANNAAQPANINAPLSNDVQLPPGFNPNPVVPGQPVNPVVPTVGAPVMPIQPQAVMPPVEPVTPEIQPAMSVPTAQIVQGVAEPSVVPAVDINMNATPSFKPDATLDEVVVGAQEMFMEGVRNLVQTIQEKVYRDLYSKEDELKKREAVIAQKEQMLNSQFATMMTNFTANFNGIQPTAPAGADSAASGNKPQA